MRPGSHSALLRANMEGGGSQCFLIPTDVRVMRLFTVVLRCDLDTELFLMRDLF